MSEWFNVRLIKDFNVFSIKHYDIMSTLIKDASIDSKVYYETSSNNLFFINIGI